MAPGTSRTVRVAPPTFFAVRAGTPATTCAHCAAVVYEIAVPSPKPKTMAVDCAVVGGRPPTDRVAGSGVAHWIYCSAPAREGPV